MSESKLPLRTPTTHVLKTEVNAWDAMERGDKTAEFRLNDRDYHVGDRLILKRGTDDKPPLTLHRVVTHALYGPAFGVPKGYVMLSCGPCDCATHETEQPNSAPSDDAVLTAHRAYYSIPSDVKDATPEWTAERLADMRRALATVQAKDDPKHWALNEIEKYFANEGQTNPACGIVMGFIAASEVRT